MNTKSMGLAVAGGSPALAQPSRDLFRWPLLDAADEAAVVDVMRDGSFPNDQLIRQFEDGLSEWLGVRFVSAEASATSGISAALFACGVGPGDEVIVPTCTYWATCMPVQALGAVPVFCDVDPETLNIDPLDIRQKVNTRTRAIVVAHVLGQPCDMEAVNAIAAQAGIPVIEDAAHAFGSHYNGCKIGQTSDICVFSFSRKALSISEGGAVVTNCKDLFERVLAWGHTERFHRGEISSPELLKFANVPLGGVTSRMNVLSAAMGLVQLQKIDARIAEIDAAMQFFCDLLDEFECIAPLRTSRGSKSTMGAWYTPHAIYRPEANGGLDLDTFKHALLAEGFDTWTWGGFSHPLHKHPIFKKNETQQQPTSRLPSAEKINAFALPAFRKYDADAIRAHAGAVAKVIQATPELIATDLQTEHQDKTGSI